MSRYTTEGKQLTQSANWHWHCQATKTKVNGTQQTPNTYFMSWRKLGKVKLPVITGSDSQFELGIVMVNIHQKCKLEL